MKKFTSLLIGCSLALTGAVMAQQPEEQQPTPAKGKQAEKTQAADATTGANAAKPEATGEKQHGAKHERAAARNAQTTEATTGANATNPEGTPAAKEHGAKHERGAGKNAQKTDATTPQSSTSTEAGTTASGQPDATAMPNAKHQKGEGKNGKNGRNARGANANAMPSATPATAASASATPATVAASATPAASVATTPVTAATANVAPTVAAATAGQPNARVKGAGKRPDPQQVQQIKAEHVNFRAQAKPEKVPAVTFNQSYRIQGSDRWQGQQYEVFRSYHPERHDERFYRSHYSRVELIGGGYYYMNAGYWYPAWGYSTSAEYYAYDGPIYVGHRTEPPDQVIADVQGALQKMGYYRGEVDGLLGPLTREALTAYQSEEGLTATAAIDEPTLDALGMGS